MKFDPKDSSLKITTTEAAKAGSLLLSAIYYFRLMAKLPVEGWTESISPIATCEHCILEAAARLGLDLGSTQPGKIDVHDYS